MQFEDKVHPLHSTILVIDMQNDFCAANGAMERTEKDIGLVQKMTPNLLDFVSSAREFKVPVIFVKAIYDSEFLSEVVLEQREEKSRTTIPLCLSGTWGAEFYGVKPNEEDLVVEKHRYSAFIKTDLENILRRHGIKTVIVCGEATNVCVESTVRDAFMLDFHVVVVEDCVASYSAADHEQSLKMINQFFGEVASSKSIVRAWLKHQDSHLVPVKIKSSTPVKGGWLTIFQNNRELAFQLVRFMNGIRNGGADINEVLNTTRRIREDVPEDWHREWAKTASDLQTQAETELAEGHTISARSKLLRASNYHRITVMPIWKGSKAGKREPWIIDTYKKSLALFEKAGSLSTPPWEKIEVDYENSTLTGYYFPPENKTSQPVPLLIYIGGADSTKEENYFSSVPQIIEHGYGCLVIDGPGQGSSLLLKSLYSRPDYETPISKIIRHMTKHDNIDRNKISLLGVSMGGYYACRGAINPEVKACVVWGACYDVLEDLYNYYPPIKSRLEWVVGANNPDEAERKLKKFTLKEVIKEVRCPTLIVHGEDDFLVSVNAAYRTYREMQCPKELKIFKSGEPGSQHVQQDYRIPTLEFILNWFESTLQRT